MTAAPAQKKQLCSGHTTTGNTEGEKESPTESLAALQQHTQYLEEQVRQQQIQLQQALEFEVTLKRVTDKVRDSLDEKIILETAVQELVEAIGVYSCNASLYDFEAGTCTIYYEYTRSQLRYHGRVIPMSAYGELYKQLLNAQYFQFCSCEPNPIRGRVAMLACPMLGEGGVVGDLWLTNYESYVFTEQDIRLVQQVANHCAIALRQARLYEHSQAQVKTLAQLNRLKDDFVSTISHELRTPMANIKMALQMLEVTLSPAIRDNPKVERYFGILKAECGREIDLLEDLLNFSRFKTGADSKLVLSLVDVRSELESLAKKFADRTTTNSQRLQISLPDVLPKLTTNLFGLERVMTELLTNACKYTPAGETIVLGAFMRQDHLHLYVSNTGVQIPVEEQTRIFEEFYRIPHNDPWRHGGTGLGLSLVKNLLEQMGATIVVHSENQETTFEVIFPPRSLEGVVPAVGNNGSIYLSGSIHFPHE